MSDDPLESQEFCSVAFIKDVVSRAKGGRALRERVAREATDKLAALASAIYGRPVKVWAECVSDSVRFEMKVVSTGAVVCRLEYPWRPEGGVGNIYTHASNKILKTELDTNPVIVCSATLDDAVKP